MVETEVVPPDSLTDIDPEEDFEGYTGNAGMTLDRWYRHAAIFIWPGSRHFDVLATVGSPQAVAMLADMIAKLQNSRGAQAAALKTQCIDFAARILAGWPANPYGRDNFNRSYSTADPISLLAPLDDPKLIKLYIKEVLVQDASIDGGKALPRELSRYGWVSFRGQLAGIFSTEGEHSRAEHAVVGFALPGGDA